MASTTALFTGLSGLTTNSRNLDVIGNNISNINTTAYKSNRILFASTFSRTFSTGTVPGATTGGTNPGQIGLGVTIAGTQRDFRGGALSATGDARDLAIEGDGFFVVNRGDAQFYTRAGSFRQNAANDLVTISGERVRGYGVDDQSNIIEGELVDLNIPVGTLTIAQQTQSVRFAGNLNAGGDAATRGAAFTLDALGLVASPVGPTPTPPNVLESTSLLIDIDSPLTPGTPAFSAGQTFQISGAQKGTKTIPDASLTVTAATTVADLLTFFNEALGIDTTTGPNPDGLTPGAALDPLTGVISIVGNTGTISDLAIDATDLRVLNADGTVNSRPFTPSRTQSANGESVRTTFVVYDSLGTPISVDLSLVLDSTSNQGTTWRYFAESADDTDVALALGSGLVSFDNFGRLSAGSPIAISVDRDNTGAVSPFTFDVNFASDSDSVTALTDVRSQIAATFQDGSPLGTLVSYAVGNDGVITGAFTNGLVRTVGQVALAKFSNAEGLVDVGSNLFTPGPNSGTPVIAAPLELGNGRVVGGALELSNVDLSQEFINLILASTGYSASSRVISTTDQLIQQLLVLGR